jgi:hypothetical protein
MLCSWIASVPTGANELPSLKSLAASNVRFTGCARSGPTPIARLDNLEVQCADVPIKRDGFACLRQLRDPFFFILRDATLTDESVRDLASLPQDGRLDLYNVRGADESLRSLEINRPDLKVTIQN